MPTLQWTERCYHLSSIQVRLREELVGRSGRKLKQEVKGKLQSCLSALMVAPGRVVSILMISRSSGLKNPAQQPLQMLLTFLLISPSCLSVFGSPVPVATLEPVPKRPDGAAVPAEFVPGDVALVPSAPPPAFAPPEVVA